MYEILTTDGEKLTVSCDLLELIMETLGEQEFKRQAAYVIKIKGKSCIL